ncbi:MAG TPA: hypothetical protein VLH94_03475 [Spirochaetia bacterium]|nr:hypothetical protein [Spirochaetia bacterium]
MLKKIINYKTVFTITTVIFVGLATVNLISTNSLSTEGITVSEAETKTLILEKENQMISVKIEEASQLKNIELVAESRGFIRSKNIVFVPTPLTFAQR